MAIDFPNSPPPESGDVYTGPNGVSYTFDGIKWIGQEMGSGGGGAGLPDQTGQAGKFLTTDGNGNASWADAQGPKGDTGDVGPKGDTGDVGPKGDTGNIGPKGDTGNIGPKGDTGDVGPQGPSGVDALWNWSGAYSAGPQYQEGDIVTYEGGTYRRNNFSNSAMGFIPTNTTYWEYVAEKGDQGVRGEQGEPGAQGQQGLQGVPGQTGSQGAPGQKGDQGIPGNDGAQGVPGSPGSPGAAGAKGDPGDTGPRGEKGDQGVPGNDSTVPGPKGDTGAQGVSVTLQGTKATIADLPLTGNAGDGWIVTTGDGLTHLNGSLWFWNVSDGAWNDIGPIVGPQGDKGDPGDQGAKGDQGVPGNDGAPGADGAKGDTGETGPRGDPGLPGAKGDKGDQGEPGEPGQTGNEGPPGQQGEQGIQGVPGQGVSTGGTLGQVLVKLSSDDYDTGWVDQIDSTDRLTAGDKTLVLGTNGHLTFPDTTVQTTAWTGQSAPDVTISTTAPNLSEGALWYNSTDGRTYVKYSDLWVDANPPVIAPVSTYLDGLIVEGTTISTTEIDADITVQEVIFTANGRIQLPLGGDIVDSTGASVLNTGAVVKRSVVFPLGAVGDTRGTIALTPAGDTYICVEDYAATDSPIWKRIIDVTYDNGDGSFTWSSPGDLTLETVRPAGYTGDCDVNIYAADDIFIEANGDDVSITASNEVSINSDGGNFEWRFNDDGSLTIPGNIRNTTDASIIVGDSVVNFDVEVVDELVPPGNVWRIFIDDSQYPNLGDTVQIGDTVTTAWGTPITATITDVLQLDGSWRVHVAQDITVGFDSGPQTVTFSSLSNKTWTFGADGGLQFPDGTTQTTAFTGQQENTVISIGASAPGSGTLWYNSTDGRTYIKYNNQWTDASPPVVPPVSTYLGGLTIDEQTISSVDHASPDVKIAGNLLPDQDLTYDLGSVTKQWNSLHIRSSTIYMSGRAVSLTDEGLKVDGQAPITVLDGGHADTWLMPV